MVVINIFLSENFTFNGRYSKDLGVSIITFDSNVFNEIGTEYKEDIAIEQNTVEYNPYYVQTPSEIKNVELNLLIYDPSTMSPIKIEESDLEEIYNWLITDNFVSFISDDDPETIYYFKVISIVKNFTFNREGYLTVTFKPYSKYCYRRKVYKRTVSNVSTFDINNPFRQDYYPMITIVNKGDETTINKINDMEIVGLANGEKIIIDNLLKLIQNSNGENKFNNCNRKWIKLQGGTFTSITVEGKMDIEFVCEFPTLL